MEMDYQSDSSGEDSTESTLLSIHRYGNALHFELPEEKTSYLSMDINGLPVVFMRGQTPQRSRFSSVTLLYGKEDNSSSGTCGSGDRVIRPDDNNNDADKEIIECPPSDIVEGNPDQDDPSVQDIEGNLETTRDLPSVPLDGPLVDDFVVGFSSDSSPFSAPSLSDLDLESSLSSSASHSQSVFSIFFPSLDPNHRLADPSKRLVYDFHRRESLENRETVSPSPPLEMQAPIWKGTISMKCFYTNIEMFVIAGSVHLATTCLSIASDHATIQINQKAEFDEEYFENRYINNDSKMTTLIALPSKVCRCCYNNLQPFQNYFSRSNMSGVVACENILGNPGVAKVMKFFPKSDLTTRYTRRLDPLLTQRLCRDSYLIITIEPM